MDETPFSEEQLWEAWERVQENQGCAGSDGVTVHQFASHAHREITRLIARVRDRSYQPFPLLKIVVEKHPGSAKTRTLLVPTVRDRVLQTAAARHLSRSFEEEFLECSYGYRPGRSVDRAIARIRRCHELGYTSVVDADIETFFDCVDHSLLLARLAERQPGELISTLIEQWVCAQFWDGVHVHRLTRGVPQGSPISPLLANFFLEDFDRTLEESGRKLVRYADDFLVLARTPEEAAQAMLQTEEALNSAHLDLNREKTRITDFDHGFQFLGALFQGAAVWVPWKHERTKGRILFMARPMPMALRERFEMLAPPERTMEHAFHTARQQPAAPPADSIVEQRSVTMAFLYLMEQGSVLRKSGDRFLVEKQDEVILDLPYHKLETVLLFGNVQVTTQALAELLEKGVNLSLFSRQGSYRGSLAPPRGKNVELRISQFEAFRDRTRALAIAREIVAAKIANGLAVLDRYRRHNEVDAGFETHRTALEEASRTCRGAENTAALDGVEGAAAHSYFEAVMQFNKSGMSWPGRQKHPAPDPLNAMLSLVYTLIMHELTGLLEGAGLDPYLGFLHQIDYGRPSLALDLMEPFRHPVGDRLALNLVNRRVVEADDFQGAGEHPGVFLSPKALKRFLAEYEEWMLAHEAPAGGGAAALPFRDRLHEEVEKLVHSLRSGEPFVPFRFDGAATGKTEGICNTSSATT